MRMKWAGLVVVLAVAWTASASYVARVTVNTGNSFVVRKLDVRGDRIYADTGNYSTSTNVITSIEFAFRGVDLKLCSTLFRSGDFKGLEGILAEHVAPVGHYAELPSNLADYLVWLLRAQYWNGNRDGAAETAGFLLKTGRPTYMDAAHLYRVLLAIDRGDFEAAREYFKEMHQPEDVSLAMTSYVRGRLAFAAGDYRSAIKHASQIMAFHSRDPEWIAPATLLEAQIYEATGQPQKVRTVALELIMAYPDSQWSRAGEALQKTSTGK